jgi:hypothetical protein
MDKSHLTAIRRNKLSAPTKWLLDNKYLSAGMLDYGCGRGDDADHLPFICWRYDPHFYPDEYDCQFDVITCHFVLNVVELKDQNDILRKIQILLSPTGNAYITVRRDVKKTGYTSKGTYQRNVILHLPVVYEKKGGFCIYNLKKMII